MNNTKALIGLGIFAVCTVVAGIEYDKAVIRKREAKREVMMQTTDKLLEALLDIKANTIAWKAVHEKFENGEYASHAEMIEAFEKLSDFEQITIRLDR